MIAGVLLLGPGRSADQVIQALAAVEQVAPSRIHSVGATTLAVWPGLSPPGHLSPGGEFACVGLVRGSLPATIADPFRIDGDFAIIAPRQDAILVASGLFGGRPLYYAWLGPDCLVACSRLLPLVRIAGGKPAANRESLAATIASLACPDAGATPYEGVRRVPSGQVLVMGRETRRAALDLTPATASNGHGVDELAETLREELLAAVERAIDGASRVAVLASGGVDSSAVLAAAVACAKRTGKADVRAVALDFAGPGDDRPHLLALCRALNVVALRVSPAECGDGVRSSMVLDGAPMPWPTASAEARLGARAREAGAEVVLSGVGGDDLLDGSPAVFAEQARAGDVLGAIRGAHRLKVPWSAPPWTLVGDFVVRPLAVPHIPRVLRSAWRRRAFARRMPWARPLVRDVVEASQQIDASRDGDAWVARMATSSRYADLAAGRAQIEGVTGCTLRAPLLDASFARAVARCPPTALLHGDRLRGLFRYAVRGLVPDSVRLRPDKADFGPALRQMVDAAGGLHAFRDLAEVRALADLGLVEPRLFLQQFERLARGDAGVGWLPIWPVLAAEAFARGVL